MPIAIASDHAGYRLKRVLSTYLSERGYTMIDFGTNSEETVKYTTFDDGVKYMEFTEAVASSRKSESTEAVPPLI